MEQVNLLMPRLCTLFLLSGCKFRPVGAPIRRHPRPCLALLAFIAVAYSTSAQQPAPTTTPPQLPSAPSAQITDQPVSGSISGFVTDSDGDSIEGAHLTLTREGAPSRSPIVAVSTMNGRFTFPEVPAGPFKLAIVATGFSPKEISGELYPGDNSELPEIALRSGSTTDVEVTATQTDIAQAQVQEEEKQRVLGFIPNFYVSYVRDPVPLDPKQKFELAFRTMIDPISLALNGVTAGVQQATRTYAWQLGAAGYAKRYAAAYGTLLTGTVIGSAALPILLKQDPRYYYKGTGSIRFRVGYAIANAVICKGDNRRWQPAYSAILGGLAASGISNAYYPASNRASPALTFEGAALGTGLAAVANLIQEFIVPRFTPHIPPNP